LLDGWNRFQTVSWITALSEQDFSQLKQLYFEGWEEVGDKIEKTKDGKIIMPANCDVYWTARK